jgi:hypothetical protein
VTLYALNTRVIGYCSFTISAIGIAVTFFTGQAALDAAAYTVRVIAAAVSVLTLFGALLGRTPAVPDDPGAKVLNPTPVPPVAGAAAPK